MLNCEPHVVSSASNGEALLVVSGEAVVKHHDIIGKSSRSIATTATVPADLSECGDDDDLDDNSVVLFVETVDDSSDDESCPSRGIEKNSVTRPTKHVPPVQTVDLLSGDAFPEPKPNSVDTDFGEDTVVQKKPRSPKLPSPIDSSKKKKKKNDAKRTIHKDKNIIEDRPMTTIRQQKKAEIPESLQRAKRARRAAIRKWESAPKPEPTAYGMYVPPTHQTAAATKKQKRKKKKKRERKTLVGAMGGMVAGVLIAAPLGVVAGPVGVVLGAAAGGFCTRQAVKKGEKRRQRKREQRSFRDYATSKGLQWHMNGDAAVFC